MKLAKTVSTGYVRDGFQDLASCGGSSHAEREDVPKQQKRRRETFRLEVFLGPGVFVSKMEGSIRCFRLNNIYCKQFGVNLDKFVSYTI